jgi:peptide/nickel transport system substrate-binding protein/oligopeptide transport system substrate-binding protein
MKNIPAGKSLRALSLSVMLFTLFAGCITAENSEAAAQEPELAQEQESPADDKTFFMTVTPPRVNLDPLHTFTSTEAQVYTAIYEGLVTYHPFTLEPMPAVAEYWEISEDRRTYRFRIRESARYWNGDQVEPDHFRQSWLTLINPENPGEYGSLLDIVKGARDFRLGNNEDPASVGIRIPEAGILEVELEKPAPHFLKILCHHSFSPLHPKMLELEDWTDLDTVLGNGPFTIISSNDEEMTLKKNQFYWDSPSVGMDTIRILYRDDPDWAADAIDNGALHWAEGDINLDLLKNKEAMVLNPIYSTTYFFFALSPETEKSYNRPDVRKALALLVPWEEVRSQQYMYLPTDSLVPKVDQYPEVTGIEAADREQAMELLAQAGFPEGAGLPEIRFLLPEGEEALRIAELMASSWRRALGVDIVMETSGFSTYYERVKNEPFTLGILTWIGDFADPLTFLQMWTGDASLNIGRYKNETFDRMVSEAAVEENWEKRYEMMAEAEQLLLDEAVVLPIKHSPAFNIIDLERIKGWFPNPLDIHPFKYLEFERLFLPDGVV